MLVDQTTLAITMVDLLTTMVDTTLIIEVEEEAKITTISSVGILSPIQVQGFLVQESLMYLHVLTMVMTFQLVNFSPKEGTLLLTVFRDTHLPLLHPPSHSVKFARNLDTLFCNVITEVIFHIKERFHLPISLPCIQLFNHLNLKSNFWWLTQEHFPHDF